MYTVLHSLFVPCNRCYGSKGSMLQKQTLPSPFPFLLSGFLHYLKINVYNNFNVPNVCSEQNVSRKFSFEFRKGKNEKCKNEAKFREKICVKLYFYNEFSQSLFPFFFVIPQNFRISFFTMISLFLRNRLERNKRKFSQMRKNANISRNDFSFSLQNLS